MNLSLHIKLFLKWKAICVIPKQKMKYKETAYSSDIGDQLKNYSKKQAYYKQLAYVKFYKLTSKL